MAISLETQWKLVAAGLMAHADQVMAGEECERLMLLVEQDVDGDEYADWLAVVSDPDRLRSHLDSLPALPPEHHRAVLEEAWLMAVVDGERDESEVKMLEQLAAKLGVEAMQLDFWREAWNQTQSDRAETTMRLLAELVDVKAHASLVEEVLHQLPTTIEHRDALRAIAELEQDRAELVRRLTTLPKALKADIMRRLSEAVAQASNAEQATAALQAIADEAGAKSS